MINTDKMNVSLHIAHIHPAASWEITVWRKPTFSIEGAGLGVPNVMHLNSCLLCCAHLNCCFPLCWHRKYHMNKAKLLDFWCLTLKKYGRMVLWFLTWVLSVFFQWGRMRNFSSLRALTMCLDTRVQSDLLYEVQGQN